MAVGITYTDQAAVVPLMRVDFDMSDVQAGLLPTSLFLSSVVTMLFISTLADRVGAKRMNVYGVALALCSNVLFAVAPSYPALLAAKAVGGIGSGMAFVGGVRYIAGLYPGARSHFGQGLYGAGYPLGSALGLQLMPPLALAFGGWRAAFVISSALIFIVLIGYAWRAPRVPAVRVPGGIRDALRSANAWWCFVEHSAGFGLQLATGTWVSIYILREFDATLVVAGVLGSLLLFTAFLLRPVGGYLIARERASTIGIMRIAQLANLSGLGCLAFPGRPIGVALAGAVLVGIGVSIPYAAVFNTAAASLPRAPGAAQSLTATGGTFGALLGAPVMGAAIERFGFSTAWAVIAIVPFAALIGTFFIRGEESFARRD